MKGFIKVTHVTTRLDVETNTVTEQDTVRIVNLSRVEYFSDHAVFFSRDMWNVRETIEEIESLIEESTSPVLRNDYTNEHRKLWKKRPNR